MKSSTVATIAKTRQAQVVTAAAPVRLLLAVNEILRGRVSMSDDDENAPVPFMQKLLDNPFLLLFLGVFIPMVLYNLWGVIDILTVPLAK